MRLDSELVNRIAPLGVLRAAINLGNPALATRPGRAGDPRGVSIDMGRALAGRLGLALCPLVFDSAAASVRAVAQGGADIGFFTVDPALAGQLRFTTPYVLIHVPCPRRETSHVQERVADQGPLPGLRRSAGKLLTIQQSVGLPAASSDEALALVRRFVEDMKDDGFVRRALERHGVAGAQVAPLA